MTRIDSDDEGKTEEQLKREKEDKFAANRKARQDLSSDATELSKTSSEYLRE